MESAELFREATHAGSWYSANKSKLRSELEKEFSEAAKTKISLPESSFLKAIISPHAGYSYCLSTAVHSYQYINPSLYKRIILMGPSHHAHLEGIALPEPDMKYYKTPLGNLQLDSEEIHKLREQGKAMDKEVLVMQKEVDEEEHSMEMQMPLIKYVFKDAIDLKIVSVLVGDVKEKEFADMFDVYVKDRESLFVVSSDFCHWGKRFGFMYYDKLDGEIYQSIEKLDRMGMDAIETGKEEEFTQYLKKYKNTICGRNPILIMLSAFQKSGVKFNTNFVQYKQSGQVTDFHDSSVSYATSTTVVFDE